ncbi:hypothetical protein AVEN_165627-1 [Araneus ventricosus]|uniref:Uncharacterized protein n=1 Tax=Araneus ventricosus TaxID=182803 RepID=A0A4Y2IK17_ARAVE|nr:hypothetical protein AVEN_165627-1 [Araneus ventricosus]
MQVHEKLSITKSEEIAEIIPPEQYSAVLEELNQKRLAGDESDASDLDGEVIEYSDHETDSEIDVKDSTVNDEYRTQLGHHPSSNLIIP